MHFNKGILLLCSLVLSLDCLAAGKARELYDRGLVEDSAPNLVNELRDMANKGDVEAQSLLGWEYYQPRYDTKPDIQEALKWLMLATEQGEGLALLALGQIYYSGEQVRVNYEKAYSFFNQAARHGEKEAWSNLGLMYANGQYVQADCNKAKEYLDKGSRIESGPKDFLSACRKDALDRNAADSTLPVLEVTHSAMLENIHGFACTGGFYVSTHKLTEVANLRITISLKNRSGKVIHETLGFAPFGMNRLNINFTDFGLDSFTSHTSLFSL